MSGNVRVGGAEPPAGWLAVSIARPPLGGGSDAVLTQWSAVRSPDSGDVLLVGCVATPIPGWIEDMRPSIEGRMVAFAVASTERLVGAEIEPRFAFDHLDLFPKGRAERIGMTRTFLGFGPGRDVATCVATCATPAASAHPGPPACEASVLSARLEGGVQAPPPGLALSVTTWVVHHPHPTVVGAGIIVFFAFAFAVVFRRRPRSRI